jgi:hypothetical protein
MALISAASRLAGRKARNYPNIFGESLMTKYYSQHRPDSPSQPEKPDYPDKPIDPRPFDPDPSPGDPIVDPADEPLL